MGDIRDWFYLSFIILFILAAITWIIFARLSMARIESEIKNDKFLWDGTGGRIIFYAYAIALPEKMARRIDERLIDASLVRKYATRADWMRGISFLIASNIWILLILAGVIIGIE